MVLILFPSVLAALAAGVSNLAPPTPPPPPPPDLRARTPDEVRVYDGQTLEIRTIPVRLYGIQAPDKAQQCQVGERFWACGAAARTALANLVANQRVYCQIAGEVKLAAASRYDPLVGRCYAGGTDLAQALVDEGLATALAPSPYAQLALQACVAAKGLWASRFEAPWTFRGRREGAGTPPLLLGRGSARPCARATRL